MGRTRKELDAQKGPSLAVAWRQALASLRVRYGRQAVTLAGIFLGVAFFSAMLAYASGQSERAQDPAELSRLRWLAGTSLLMMLVGVANSMLMSVTERYREIGTFKCLGAPDAFIVAVFLIEATLLALVGSGLGAAAGAFFMWGALAVQGAAPEAGAALSAAGAAGLAGALLTVAAAILPAIQAARMPAVAALRVEV
jgi:putative ABC transport system permease protein